MQMTKFVVLFFLLSFVVYVCSEELEDQGLNEEEKEARKEALEVGALELIGVIAATLSVANPVSAATVVIGTIMFSNILKKFDGKATDAWDQLEDRIDIKIGAKLAASKVNELKQEVLFPLNRRIMKGDNFGSEDLDEILDRMAMVIPSNQELGWNYDLPLAMVYYVPYMIAGYHKMIDEKKQPKCALANSMQLYKAKVIRGLKEMMRKRYKSIFGKTQKSRRVNCKKRNITKRGYGGGGFSGGKKACVHFDDLVTYEDTITKKEFILTVRNGHFHGNSWDNEVNKIRKETVDFLFKEVAEKINKYFTQKICLANIGCACPEPITRSEIDFAYPKTCFGSTSCRHPAGKFGSSYYWCYINTVANDYLKTNKIDFDTCMPVEQDTIEPLNILDKM